MEQKIIRIKKYGNRRLYSTSEKRYFTLKEIEQLVVDGDKIEVVDAQTDKDITSEILTQILLERGKARHLPSDTLEQMVRLNEDALSSFFSQTVNQGIEMMERVQKDMEPLYKMFSINRFFPFLPRTEESSELRDLKRRLEELEKRQQP